MNKMGNKGKVYTLNRRKFHELIDVLIQMGYAIIGPTIKDSAILYDQITSVDDLPIGWTDEQDAGSYQLKQREDQALFGFNVGPNSFKKNFHLPKKKLWHAKKGDKGVEIFKEKASIPKTAYLGVRACDLHGVLIQDKVLMGGPYIQEDYKARRNEALVIAVNCGKAGKTCFCCVNGIRSESKKWIRSCTYRNNRT